MVLDFINHKKHGMYQIAMVQVSNFSEVSEFNEIRDMLTRSFGKGIIRKNERYNNFNRNKGDDSVWYYRQCRGNARRGKIYITTPAQLTMVQLCK